MLFYLVLSIILLLLAFHIFLKIKFRFWSSQPVFHLHNIIYWLWPPGILEHGHPPMTKFYDSRVQCGRFENIPIERKLQFYFLIKTHYLYNKKATYNPTKEAVLEYFKCHEAACYLSLGYGETSQTLISCMTTRPLSCYIEDQKLEIGYVDFLCIHSGHRRKGVAPRQIYSHYYRSRQLGSPPIFLFKREGNVNLLVPLTIYFAYVFAAATWSVVNLNLPNNISCHIITVANIELLYHYFGEIKEAFSCVIIPSLSHLKNLIKHGLLLPCILMDNNKTVGIYFYHYPYTSYSGKQSIECMASYVSPGYEKVFIDSFPNTVALLQHKVPFELIVIENISNNNLIIKNMLEKDRPEWKCPMAYYFYNFIYRPFSSTDIFLLN